MLHLAPEAVVVPLLLPLSFTVLFSFVYRQEEATARAALLHLIKIYSERFSIL